MKIEENKFILKEELKREVHKAGPFTVVTVTTPLGMEAVGISKKSEGEKLPDNYGTKIATGRAMKSLIKKLNGVKIVHQYMG